MSSVASPNNYISPTAFGSLTSAQQSLLTPTASVQALVNKVDPNDSTNYTNEEKNANWESYGSQTTATGVIGAAEGNMSILIGDHEKEGVLAAGVLDAYDRYVEVGGTDSLSQFLTDTNIPTGDIPNILNAVNGGTGSSSVKGEGEPQNINSASGNGNTNGPVA